MGILDGFWFWIGKQIAEFVIFIFVVCLIAAFVIWIEHSTNKSKRSSGDEERTK